MTDALPLTAAQTAATAAAHSAAGEAGTVLVCRCSNPQVIEETAAQTVVSRLHEAGARVVVVSDLCGLAARRDPRLGRLLASPAPAIAACHPRAVRWLLAAAGLELADGAELVNLRTQPAEDVAAALSRDRGGGDEIGGDEIEVTTLRRDERWVPWFPVIDYDRCNGCRQCASFCLFGVFGTAGDGSVVVERPDACKNNCPACARICPEAAIIFPKLEESPLNGAEITDAELAKAAVKVDVDQMLGDDIYQALMERRRKTKRKLLRKKDLERALAERERCACQGGSAGGLVTLSPPTRRRGDAGEG